MAVSTALQLQRQFTLWLDNQAVYDVLQSCKQGNGRLRTRRQKDHILWNRLVGLVQKAIQEDLALGFVKVQSHAVVPDDLPTVEAWALKGNQAADQGAASAVRTLPNRVLTMWERACAAADAVVPSRLHMHKLLVSIGERAVTETGLDEVEPVDAPDLPVVRVRETQVSFWPFPTSFTPYPPNVGVHADHVMRWLHALVNADDAEPNWVTSYHLLAYYQISAKRLGFRYVNATNSWESIDDVNSFAGPSFLKCSRWFLALLKHLTTFYGMSYIHEACIPSGNLFTCWTKCLRIPCSGRLLVQVETVMAPPDGQKVRVLRPHFARVVSYTDRSLP